MRSAHIGADRPHSLSCSIRSSPAFRREKSSGAVPFGTMFALLVLWFGISVPLVFLGSYFGYRRKNVDFPVRINQIPRQVPEQVWYMQPAFSIVVGGVLPFGAVFIELFFILSSIWLHQVQPNKGCIDRIPILGCLFTRLLLTLVKMVLKLHILSHLLQRVPRRPTGCKFALPKQPDPNTILFAVLLRLRFLVAGFHHTHHNMRRDHSCHVLFPAVRRGLPLVVACFSHFGLIGRIHVRQTPSNPGWSEELYRICLIC